MALRIRVAVFCSYEAFGATASFTGTSATPTLGSIFPVALSLIFGNEQKEQLSESIKETGKKILDMLPGSLKSIFDKPTAEDLKES